MFAKNLDVVSAEASTMRSVSAYGRNMFPVNKPHPSLFLNS